MSIVIDSDDLPAKAWSFDCLRHRFSHFSAVMVHSATLHQAQRANEAWRETEYREARRLANQALPWLFDRLTSAEIETVAWSDIADDVRALSTLAENPL
jgi:hypothetical protein